MRYSTSLLDRLQGRYRHLKRPLVDAPAAQRDPAVIDTGRKMLERLGYRVATHGNADAALADYRVAPVSFDLVFTDLTMPGRTGLELLAAVRAIRAEQACVLCSGILNEADRQEAARLGVSVVLTKPLNLATLAAAVTRALGEK